MTVLVSQTDYDDFGRRKMGHGLARQPVSRPSSMSPFWEHGEEPWRAVCLPHWRGSKPHAAIHCPCWPETSSSNIWLSSRSQWLTGCHHSPVHGLLILFLCFIVEHLTRWSCAPYWWAWQQWQQVSLAIVVPHERRSSPLSYVPEVGKVTVNKDSSRKHWWWQSTLPEHQRWTYYVTQGLINHKIETKDGSTLHCFLYPTFL